MMISLNDLSNTLILAFEIGDDCNLKKQHKDCPINLRIYKHDHKSITVKMIVESIKQAKELNFDGHVAFHHYNEPLLYKDKILEVIEQIGDCKFLLWTNGTLLDRDVSKNEFLRKFDLVYITCYNKEYMAFFNEVLGSYKNVQITQGKFDDRLDSYDRCHKNNLSCKRPIFELPIDYYGNVRLCSYDWKNTYSIGNINNKSFKEIINSEIYQEILRNSNNGYMCREICPEVCLNCNKPLLELEGV